MASVTESNTLNVLSTVPMVYLYSPECTVSEQNSGTYVHKGSISRSQVDIGDVLAEVVMGQDHHGSLVPL